MHEKRDLLQAQPEARAVAEVQAGRRVQFVDNGNTGFPDPDVKAKLAAFHKKYPQRKLRKGEKGAAQLLKEARDSR